jgi:hypothetical protein
MGIIFIYHNAVDERKKERSEIHPDLIQVFLYSGMAF